MSTPVKSTLLAAGLTVAAVLTGAAGWIDGRLGNRWATPADLQGAAQRLAAVPTQFGDWQMQSNEPLSPEVEKMLQCAGNFSRVYVNTVTGESVGVAAIVGPSGPTAVHTPEICYTSRDHVELDKPTPVSIRPQERPNEELWRMTFLAKDLGGTRLRVYYGWSDASGVWSASAHPRFKYSGQPLLYKIQLAARMPEVEESDGGDPCQRFLESFLPVLDATLFP